MSISPGISVKARFSCSALNLRSSACCGLISRFRKTKSGCSGILNFLFSRCRSNRASRSCVQSIAEKKVNLGKTFYKTCSDCCAKNRTSMSPSFSRRFNTCLIFSSLSAFMGPASFPSPLATLNRMLGIGSSANASIAGTIDSCTTLGSTTSAIDYFNRSYQQGKNYRHSEQVI
jgi:hypothetical protein